MGTIAARDCLRVLQLTEQVVASTLLASIQGLRLRIALGEVEFSSLTADVQTMFTDINDYFALLDEDRPLEEVLRFTVHAIQTKRWSLYE